MLLPSPAYCLVAALAVIATAIATVPKHLPTCTMIQTESKPPDYGVWEAVLQRHVKPSSIRGIPVHSVDYEGECHPCRRVIHGSSVRTLGSRMKAAVIQVDVVCVTGVASNNVEENTLLPSETSVMRRLHQSGLIGQCWSVTKVPPHAVARSTTTDEVFPSLPGG